MGKVKAIRTVRGLTLYSTKGMPREEWLKRRNEGIGGSDMSSILGLNKRFSAVELFYQKSGLTFDASENINAAMHWGNVHEPVVLDHGQYLDVHYGLS